MCIGTANPLLSLSLHCRYLQGLTFMTHLPTGRLRAHNPRPPQKLSLLCTKTEYVIILLNILWKKFVLIRLFIYAFRRIRPKSAFRPAVVMILNASSPVQQSLPTPRRRRWIDLTLNRIHGNTHTPTRLRSLIVSNHCVRTPLCMCVTDHSFFFRHEKQIVYICS